jgi:hypothetical protein
VNGSSTVTSAGDRDEASMQAGASRRASREASRGRQKASHAERKASRRAKKRHAGVMWASQSGFGPGTVAPGPGRIRKSRRPEGATNVDEVHRPVGRASDLAEAADPLRVAPRPASERRAAVRQLCRLGPWAGQSKQVAGAGLRRRGLRARRHPEPERAPGPAVNTGSRLVPGRLGMASGSNRAMTS